MILRENYDSVISMRDFNEALDRIDSSFLFALAGRRTKTDTADDQYRKRGSFSRRPREGAGERHLAGGAELRRPPDRPQSSTIAAAAISFFAARGEARSTLFRRGARSRGSIRISTRSRMSPARSRMNEENMKTGQPAAARRLARVLAALVRRRAGLAASVLAVS